MASTDKPIRIAVLTKPLDNWRSGSGHHLDALMNRVLELNDGSFEFTFVHYSKSDNPIYSRVREIIIPRNPLAASLIISGEKFDIVHYSPLSVFAPVWFVRAKKIATVHGIEEVLYPEGYSLIHRFHDTVIQPMYMRWMDRIATVSETGRRYFIEHYGIDERKVFITTNGISQTYRVLPGTERLSLNQKGINDKYVLHISKFSMRKNPLSIFRGFAGFIQATGFPHQLVCAGSGWDSESALDMAREAGIADRYVAPGFVSMEDAVQLLNGAEAFVFPSFAEGFGMPNIEAMACGCPVVTSNVFAIPEVVADAACVIHNTSDAREISDALARITTDTVFRDNLIKKGFDRISRYTWDASAQSLLNEYRRMVDDKI